MLNGLRPVAAVREGSKPGSLELRLVVGPPALIRHRPCGHLTAAEIRCSHCGELLHAADTEVPPTR